MSKIFISHSHKDKGLHDALRDALIVFGYDVIGVDSLSVGSNIPKDLNKLLHSADAVIAILTNESLKSRYVINEITVALAQIDAVDNKLFLPIVVGENIEIPNYLLDRFVEMVPNFMDPYLNKVVSNIHRAIERNNAEQKKRSVRRPSKQQN